MYNSYKGFYIRWRNSQDDINKLSCSVYRIKKAENFNASDLSTIRTKVTKIR